MATGVEHVDYVGTGGVMLPVLIFSAARAATPFCPLKYRLSKTSLLEIVERLPISLAIADGEYLEAVAGEGHTVVESSGFLEFAGTATVSGRE